MKACVIPGSSGDNISAMETGKSRLKNSKIQNAEDQKRQSSISSTMSSVYMNHSKKRQSDKHTNDKANANDKHELRPLNIVRENVSSNLY